MDQEEEKKSATIEDDEDYEDDEYSKNFTEQNIESEANQPQKKDSKPITSGIAKIYAPSDQNEDDDDFNLDEDNIDIAL